MGTGDISFLKNNNNHMERHSGPGSANHSKYGAVTSSSKAATAVSLVSSTSLSPAEEAVERAVASGIRSVVDGIVFPNREMARKMQKMATIATKGTFVVTCFVDVSLSPPEMSTATGDVGNHNGSNQQVASRPTFPPADVGADHSIVAHNYHQRRDLVSLQLQLMDTPKGPYLVRVPVSATVRDAAAIIQSRLREIQRQEIVELQNASEHRAGVPARGAAPQTLYGTQMVDLKVVAHKRETAVTSQHPTKGLANAGGSSSPPLRTAVSDDLLGAHTVGIRCLAALPILIPDVGGTFDSDDLGETRRQLAASEKPRRLQPFSAFLSEPQRETMAPSLEPYRKAFEKRILTLRPCDAEGRVLRAANIHETTSTDVPLSGWARQFGRFPPDATLMTCFPRGTTTFLVALAPDDEYHRRFIHELHRSSQATQAEQAACVEASRASTLAIIEQQRQRVANETLRTSLLRDQSLRNFLNQPAATDRYKAFVKEEAREEFEKQQARLKASAEEARALTKARVCEAMKQCWAMVANLHKVLMECIQRLHTEEAAEWKSICVQESHAKHQLGQRVRILSRMRFVEQTVSEVAVASLLFKDEGTV